MVYPVNLNMGSCMKDSFKKPVSLTKSKGDN